MLCFIWNLYKGWKKLRLGKERNNRKDQLEQDNFGYLRNDIFCNMKQLLNYNLNWILQGIFLLTIKVKNK